MVLMMASTSATFAWARSATVGYLSQSAGVTLFTPLSVVCAERSTAMVRRNGSSP